MWQNRYCDLDAAMVGYADALKLINKIIEAANKAGKILRPRGDVGDHTRAMAGQMIRDSLVFLRQRFTNGARPTRRAPPESRSLFEFAQHAVTWGFTAPEAHEILSEDCGYGLSLDAFEKHFTKARKALAPPTRTRRK